jgi:hypothetical protein
MGMGVAQLAPSRLTSLVFKSQGSPCALNSQMMAIGWVSYPVMTVMETTTMDAQTQDRLIQPTSFVVMGQSVLPITVQRYAAMAFLGGRMGAEGVTMATDFQTMVAIQPVMLNTDGIALM